MFIYKDMCIIILFLISYMLYEYPPSLKYFSYINTHRYSIYICNYNYYRVCIYIYILVYILKYTLNNRIISAQIPKGKWKCPVCTNKNYMEDVKHMSVREKGKHRVKILSSTRVIYRGMIHILC